ncbi:response regulator transcription factor [Allofournierella massiliensis]|uniref:Stage 0 sporulation protein A homolog n=1 Tax=Allofournierella massiliensis TaxID=1650663 RepID=A0A4V2QBU8_9FIRM|nr:response regulator transcription factor [Fournierella massiliensis]TCL57792.1 DNA-binding response OmpR family regulator [Fournierella massiliensis]
MDQQACILVVDDDADIVNAVRLYLEKEGFCVYGASDGFEALDVLEQRTVHLILMDVMMPRMDGFSAILRIRQKHNLPILVMSAKTEDSDKVLGLSIGADDYISKPFSPTELVARVKSHLRRYLTLGGAQSGGPLVRVGRLEYDFEAHQLTADGEPVRLTPTETRIMELFFRSPGRVFSAEEIYAGAWGEGNVYAPENTVMVHIRRIREKIELNPKEPEYVKVVWGLGYKLEKH